MSVKAVLSFLRIVLMDPPCEASDLVKRYRVSDRAMSPGAFEWAAQYLALGHDIRRASWPPNRKVSFCGSLRTLDYVDALLSAPVRVCQVNHGDLTEDDINAHDWEAVPRPLESP